jgi:glycerophosphoryl diester phosphodiesterase
MHLIDRIPEPVIFAHRGASKYAPENTMAAFRLACSQGAPAIELDTMLTRDGVPVVIHDDTLDRTTNAGGRVRDMTLSEIRRVDAGVRFSEKFKGEAIPTLEEVLFEFKDKLLINIELKNYQTLMDDLPIKVAEIVGKLDDLDSVLFSSFQPLNLIRIRKTMPKARVALLVEDGFWWRILASHVFKFISPEFIHPYRSYINNAYLKKEHRAGRRVNSWTIDDPNEAKNFIEEGINGLITMILKRCWNC